MKRPLILIGGGGHCKSVIEVAESAGYEIKGILDMPDEVGKDVLPGYKVIGTDDEIPQYVEECDFVITVGFIKNPAIRIKLYNKVKAAGGRLATIIASTAFVNAGAKIGDNCIINTFVNIEHDAEVGNQCHISTGTMVNGECKIGENCFIGSLSVCANCIEIASDIIVGAGSVVRKSIRMKGIYAGNPAILKIKAK